MPRQSKGARLWLRPERWKAGKIYERSSWIIRDGSSFVATGCAPGEIKAAERKLAEYISLKYRPERTSRETGFIDVADVLSIYDEDNRDRIANKTKHDERLTRLASWWGGKMLSEINPQTCAEYVKSRASSGGARRDLEDLRAAVNYHAKQQLHTSLVTVTLPAKGLPRDRWLTRGEAARLLWACWTYREQQTVHRGKAKGKVIETQKRPLRHLARFILIGLYTGSRAGAVSLASPYRQPGRAWVDLECGLFYRRAEGARETNKRQTPVPIPAHLLAHMRRWVNKGIVAEHFVEWNGAPVKSVKTAWKRAVGLAKLEGKVSPHTLRHTAATWLMQEGIDKWTAAGFLGMSVEMLDRVYGHHHPDYLRSAAKAFKQRRQAA